MREREQKPQCNHHHSQAEDDNRRDPVQMPFCANYQYNRISFWLNGIKRSADVPPAMTTLDFVHKQLGMFGTKCSCNEGDCGACTVVLSYPKDGKVCYESINSCLYPASRLHGKHLITIEGLGTPENLHPIQSVMLDFHSTQCGYCTPGFVMSLFALLATHRKPNTERIMAALEGNLCRCTGYDSILKAAVYLSAQYDIDTILPEWCRKVESQLLSFDESPELIDMESKALYHTDTYYLPQSLNDLFDLMESKKATGFKLISGGTDIMVQINIARQKFPILIDVSQIEVLKTIHQEEEAICIGANSTYTEVLNSTLINRKLPELGKIIQRIASEQIRNFATLAGNIGNASPIADSIPVLMVYGASLKLFSKSSSRVVPLCDYFLDYKKTELKANEIIGEILIPIPPDTVFVRAIKASKRKSVDISAVSTAIMLQCKDGIVSHAELALGGVAKTPILSSTFKDQIIGQDIFSVDAARLARMIEQEIDPISDVRGTEWYRQKLIRNHILIYLKEAVEHYRRQG